MKEITNIICTRIILEPGDLTRYDFIVKQDYDEFVIMPYKSIFPFPQRLHYVDIIDITTIEDAVNACNKSNKLKLVNPHTYLQVCKILVEIYNKEYETL